MKIAGFYDESISNGLGWRAVLFVSGCTDHCPGCHNEVAQNYDYGKEFNEQEILERIQKNSILNGITISGGEPLCKENISEVGKFIQDVRKIKPNFDVWCYTGYTLEQLEARNDDTTNKVLQNIDVLVDGKFIQESYNPVLKFRVWVNQRILVIRISLKE